MILGEKQRPPLKMIHARPAHILYTDMNGVTKWRRMSMISSQWSDGDDEARRGEQGYVFRMFDHDQHKMCSIVPERIHKWEQEK